MRGFIRTLMSLVIVGILAVSAGACGSSSKVSSDSNQAKSEVNATEQQVLKDPKVKKQVTNAENNLVKCGLQVQGHLKKKQAAFLSCEGFSKQEIDRAKPCLDKTVKDVSVFSLRSKAKRDQLVITVVKCTTG